MRLFLFPHKARSSHPRILVRTGRIEGTSAEVKKIYLPAVDGNCGYVIARPEKNWRRRRRGRRSMEVGSVARSWACEAANRGGGPCVGGKG